MGVEVKLWCLDGEKPTPEGHAQKFGIVALRPRTPETTIASTDVRLSLPRPFPLSCTILTSTSDDTMPKPHTSRALEHEISDHELVSHWDEEGQELLPRHGRKRPLTTDEV